MKCQCQALDALFSNARVKIVIVTHQVEVWKINIGTLNKARRSDLLNLWEEYGIELPVKLTILILIKQIKNLEEIEEDF